MGGTARSLLGYEDQLTTLCVPSINIAMVIKYLTMLERRYPNDVDSIIAAYNAGSAKRNDDGSFRNQSYVDKVKHVYENLVLFKPHLY